jgi:hypothetical protein
MFALVGWPNTLSWDRGQGLIEKGQKTRPLQQCPINKHSTDDVFFENFLTMAAFFLPALSSSQTATYTAK